MAGSCKKNFELCMGVLMLQTRRNFERFKSKTESEALEVIMPLGKSMGLEVDEGRGEHDRNSQPFKELQLLREMSRVGGSDFCK